MLIFAEMTNRITMRQTKRVIALGQLGPPVRIRKTGDCRPRFGASVPAEPGGDRPRLYSPVWYAVWWRKTSFGIDSE